MADFEKAFAYTTENEGDFSNDKFDSGGATKYGCTIGDLSEYYGRPATIDEVRNLSLDVVKLIFKSRYWDKIHLDQIENDNVACALYDISIVRGVGIPPQYAQKICNAMGADLKVDGVMGPKTIAAINAVEPRAFIRQFSAKARNGFLAIVAFKPTQARFLKGWLRRADRLLTLISSDVA